MIRLLNRELFITLFTFVSLLFLASCSSVDNSSQVKQKFKNINRDDRN